MKSSFFRTRRCVLCMVIAAGAVAAISGSAYAAAGPNLVVNGSFESPAVPLGTFGIFPVIPGWNFGPTLNSLSTGIEIQNNVAGSPAVLPAGALPAGQQFAELDSDGSSNYFQSIPTIPGNTYRLEFLYSPRPNTPAAENVFRAIGGNQSVVLGPLTSGTNTMWANYSFTFVASALSTEIRFEDLGPSDGLGSYIDRVSVRQQ